MAEPGNKPPKDKKAFYQISVSFFFFFLFTAAPAPCESSRATAESELPLLAYATAATDPSHICDYSTACGYARSLTH